jgi:hypothetical protein
MVRYLTAGRPRPGFGKYGVAPKDRRTYNGVVYHSLAEARRAQILDLLVRGNVVIRWERQVKHHLGTVHNVYVVDFVVYESDGSVHAEDVKGCRTRDFARNVKLWRDYGAMPLHLLTPGGRNRWAVEIIDPKGKTPHADATDSSHRQKKKPVPAPVS